MKIKLAFFSLIACAISVQAQGTFTNLNFESASLTPVPAGQYGGTVSASQAFPGWTVTDGYEPLQVYQNNASLGTAVADIFGPDWQAQQGFEVISGNYTAALQAGEVSRGIVSAILEQNGQIPANAKSITFEATGETTGGFLTVGFNGQNLPYIHIGSGQNGSEVYGADVSQYAGQSGTLAFSENPVGQNNFPSAELDDIVFSTNSIPEPSTWALVLLGAGIFGATRCVRFGIKGA